MNNTWGISGPAFLALYAALLAVAAGMALWAGRGRRDATPTTGDLDQYEVALLNGGEQLAATVALVNLQHRGELELGDRLLRTLDASGDVDLDTLGAKDLAKLDVAMRISLGRKAARRRHPVEAAVYDAAREADPREPAAVLAAAGRSSALAHVRGRLAQRGLVYDGADIDRMRGRWRWLLPVLGLGLVRAAVGLSRGRPIGFLVLLLAATVAVMVAIGRRRLHRTRRGNRLLADLQAGGVMASSVPMAVALRGTDSLWERDRALALAVTAPATASVSRWRSDGRHGGGFSHWAACGGGGGAGCGGGGGGGCGGGGGGGGCGG